MVRRRRRRCRYCQRLFRPEPHIKKQKSCGLPECAKKRKSESDEKWLRKLANREYFCGRYAHVKAWLAKPKNRGYLRRYRQKRRDTRAGKFASPEESVSMAGSHSHSAGPA